MRKPCPPDLTDERRALLQPPTPASEAGRPRQVAMREVPDAIADPSRSGCRRGLPPRDLPPGSAGYDRFARRRGDGTRRPVMGALRRRVRVAGGRQPSPSAGGIASRTVKGPGVGGARGYDGGKELSGEAAPHRRHAGAAAGGRRLGGLGRRRDEGPRGAGADDRGASQPAGAGAGRLEVPRPWAGVVDGGGGGRLPGRGGERPAGLEGVRGAAEAVGGRADLGPAGAVPPAQPALGVVPEPGEAMIRISSIHRMLRLVRPNRSSRRAPFKYRKVQE